VCAQNQDRERNHKGIGVHVEGLTKFFGRQRIREDVTFDRPAGEVSVLLGPSGTGKSVFVVGMHDCKSAPSKAIGTRPPKIWDTTAASDTSSTTGPRCSVEWLASAARTRSRCRREVILKEVHEPEREYRVVISCNHVSCAFDFDRLRPWHQI
jgi:hypothetical protein